jgi:hypothetical protein
MVFLFNMVIFIDFRYLKNYQRIPDVGFRHRAEPWEDLAVQPQPAAPNGETP